MGIGKNIKKYRKKQGLTQKGLANKLNTTPQNLAQYENGKRNPKPETIQKIATALNVNPLVLTGQISESLSNNLKTDSNIEKAYFDIFKYIYGKIDIVQEKDANGYYEYNYILGSEPNSIKISDLTFDNITECIDYFIKLYVKTVTENDESQECFSLLHTIKDMELSDLEKITEFAQFIKNKRKDPDNIVTIELTPNAAHAVNPTEEEKKHADEIMKDDSIWD